MQMNFRLDYTTYGSISKMLFLLSGVTKLVLRFTFETKYTLIRWNAHKFSIDFVFLNHNIIEILLVSHSQNTLPLRIHPHLTNKKW